MAFFKKLIWPLMLSKTDNDVQIQRVRSWGCDPLRSVHGALVLMTALLKEKQRRNRLRLSTVTDSSVCAHFTTGADESTLSESRCHG